MIMPRFECRCPCGFVFVTFALEGEQLRCPKCGKSIRVSLKDRDLEKKAETDRLVQATYDIMGEGGFSPSGAR